MRRRFGRTPLTALAALAAGACLSACTTPPLPPGPAACTAIAQQALPGTRIKQASNNAADDKLPEHCVVQGAINERTGADGKPYAIGFELRLPSAWNGRFFYQGGGGNDGVLNPAVGRNTGALGAVDNALKRGFAVVATDAGHQGTDASFGLDPQARIDHAYNAHDQTAVTAKKLIGRYYGRAPDKSYFIGCSGGGRQGMMFSQRFPDYFDGIVAVAPAMRVAQGASVSVAWSLKQFMQVAPRDASGKPVLSQAVSDTDLALLARGVLDKCDAFDGLKDGLVSFPAACRFDTSVLQCPTGVQADTCIQPAKMAALDAHFNGPRNSAGETLYFPWPLDPGVAAPGWRAWTLGTATTGPSDARFLTLMAGAMGQEFITPPDPGFDVLKFNFDTDPQRMAAFNRIYTTAEDVELKAFKQRGGKLLFAHGMADPIFSAKEMVDYYERLAEQHGGLEGGVQSFSRLFLVPGMTHCAGGPATDAFDGLSAIVNWVEKGEAPASLPARGTTALSGVNRPLCPYPQHTHYKGSGDVNTASSFVCR